MASHAAVIDAGLPGKPVPPASVDEAVIGAFSLRLIEREGSCAVRFRGVNAGAEEGELALSLAPPCRFARKPPGQYPGACGVRSFTYDDIRATVALVVGIQRAADDDAAPVPTSVDACTKQPCGNARQGLVLSQQVTLSSLHSTRHTACPSNGPDEKDFWMLSHPPKVDSTPGQ